MVLQIFVNWTAADPESNLHDFSVGISSTSSFLAPDISPFASSKHHSQYETYHPGIAAGQTFYVVIEATNKAGLSTYRVCATWKIASAVNNAYLWLPFAKKIHEFWCPSFPISVLRYSKKALEHAKQYFLVRMCLHLDNLRTTLFKESPGACEAILSYQNVFAFRKCLKHHLILQISFTYVYFNPLHVNLPYFLAWHTLHHWMCLQSVGPLIVSLSGPDFSGSLSLTHEEGYLVASWPLGAFSDPQSTKMSYQFAVGKITS